MKNKLLTLLLCIVLAVSCFAGCSPASNNATDDDTEQSEVAAVTEVVFQYANKDVTGGTMNVDLSAKTLQLGAIALRGYEEDEDATVEFKSDNEKVAIINRRGLVTLMSAGEAALTASYEGISHTIVLIVGNSSADRTYSITVNGGKASETRAFAGDYVTLTPSMPMHKSFLEWSFPFEVEWINGNTFKMPAYDVEIVAKYKDVLYRLDAVGGRISSANGKSVTGTPAGNTQNGTSPRFDVTTYEFAYGTKLCFEPYEVDGYSVVAIERDEEGNRLSDVIELPYEFDMYGKKSTLTAVYSETKTDVAFTANNFNTAAGYKTITNGVVSGETEDESLNGLSGYRFAIPANTKSGNHGLVSLKNSDTISGRKSVHVIMKNNYTKTLDIGFGYSLVGASTKSEIYSVAPGETVEGLFTLNISRGYNWVGGSTNQMVENGIWLNLVLDKDIGGASSEVALVDICFEFAELYPEGDPLFAVDGTPQSATFGATYIHYNFNGLGYRRPEYSADMKKWQIYYAPGDFHTNGSGLFIANGLGNTPAYASKPNFRAYVRLTSISEDPVIGTGFRIVVSTDLGRTNILAEKTVMITEKGQQILFYLDVNRTSNASLNISFEPVVSTSAISSGYYTNAVVEVFYNNVIGVEE